MDSGKLLADAWVSHMKEGTYRGRRNGGRVEENLHKSRYNQQPKGEVLRYERVN